MHREHYNMQHFTFLPMRIGQLQTLATFPVYAGDSVSLDTGIIARLSPLRRQLVVDPNFELFAFYVPHRHIYGDKWIDFIEQGIDENVALDTITPPRNLEYLGCFLQQASAIPLHQSAGYNQIWNRYFRVPSDQSASQQAYGELADTALLDNTDQRDLYGQLCAHLKTIWNTGLISDVSDEDVNVPVSGGAIDVRTFEQIQARYGSEQARAFFAAADRYKDVLRLAFGTGKGLNIDADQRPQLLMHSANHLSGGDVDGTGDTSLGQFSGKAIGQFRFGFPRKFFQEHGTIWILALMRYPAIVHDEAQYQQRKANPSYKEMACDPRILAAEPPQKLNEIFSTIMDYDELPVAAREELIPYGNWFRTLPQARVHVKFEDLQGFPFIQGTDLNSSYKSLHYVNPGHYDQVFQSPSQLGHAQAYSKFHLSVKRAAPAALSSVFAGAK